MKYWLIWYGTYQGMRLEKSTPVANAFIQLRLRRANRYKFQWLREHNLLRSYV